MKIKPYLSFNGNAEEALSFYSTVFNGSIEETCRYGEYLQEECPAEYKDKIIHSDLGFGGCTIGIADLLPATKADFGSLGHTITIFCDTEDQIRNIYNQLSVGGHIKCEPSQPPYAKFYAEIVDKFGVLWALIIE